MVEGCWVTWDWITVVLMIWGFWLVLMATIMAKYLVPNSSPSSIVEADKLLLKKSLEARITNLEDRIAKLDEGRR